METSESTPTTKPEVRPDGYVGVKGAASILDYSESTLRKKLDDDRKAKREGRPPTGPPWIVMPDGKSIRYRVADLLAWAASGQERGEVHYAEKIRKLAQKRHPKNKAWTKPKSQGAP